MPVYNAAPWLGACIDSVLAQSFPDWELILVNDGSTDPSGSICDQYADVDPRICVIHQENRGVGTARNQGIRAARGSYICFMDSDDAIDPSMLADMIQAVTETDADCVMGGLTYVYEETGESHAYTVREGLVSLPQGLNERYREFADARILNSHCGKLFKKEIMNRHSIGMVEGISVLEDGIFVLDYLAHSSSVYCLPTAPYRYRQTAAPSLQKQYTPSGLEAWVLYAQKYRRLTEHLDEENIRSVYSMLWHRYRALLTDVYAGSGMSTADKRVRLKVFVKAVHGLHFFKDLPRCPERKFRKRLLFTCVKRKLSLPLHLLLCLRFPTSN